MEPTACAQCDGHAHARACLGLAFAVLLCALGCRSEVRAGVPEDEANRIVVMLDRASIAARKEREPSAGRAPRYRIEVPSSESAHAIAVLQAHARPSTPADEVERDEPSLVPTLADERARERERLEASLAASLRSLSGVVDARVHIALPSAPQPLDAPVARPRAAVLLRRQADAKPLEAAQVRALVAGAVADLDAADVTLTQDVAVVTNASRQLVWVGPFAVSAAHARPLRLLLAVLLVLNLLLAGGLIVLLQRQRRH